MGKRKQTIFKKRWFDITTSDITAPGRGCTSDVAAARAALAALKAVAAFSDHTKVFGLPRSRSVSGWSVPAIPGRKRR